ncbi:MAG: hypothetical protein WED11_07965 [Natronospirillum sp.]
MQARTAHRLSFLLIPLALLIGGCGAEARASIDSTVTLSWDANRESGVNSTGGGYRVYHSTTSGFHIDNANVTDVPHASGTTPTSTTLTLSSGTHYIKIAAYSAFNPDGSTPSNQLTVTAP